MRRIAAGVALALVVIAGSACQAPPPVELAAQTRSYTVNLNLDAASLGPRVATIRIAGGEPVHVIVASSMVKMPMPGPTIVASKVDDDEYEARAEFFTMLGEWRLEVRLTGQGVDEVATFDVTAVP